MTMWGILTHLLYPEGIRSLGVEIGGILILLRASSKPAEATGGARQRFIGLVARETRSAIGISSLPAVGSHRRGEGHTFCKRTRGS